MLKRSDLKPGMTVMNSSTGTLGVTRADPKNPKKLYHMANWAVAVNVIYSTGAKGHTGWWLHNVIIPVPIDFKKP